MNFDHNSVIDNTLQELKVQETAAQSAESQKKQQQAINLAAAKVAAEGLLQGLQILQGLPGSTFNFKATEGSEIVHIVTNIDFPVGPHGGRSSVVITVGQPADPYDRRPEASQEMLISGRGEMSANAAREPDAAARILSQVATMAANWKLVPTTKIFLRTQDQRQEAPFNPYAAINDAFKAVDDKNAAAEAAELDKKQKKAAKLQEAKGVAKELIAGLQALKDRPGSKFDFKATDGEETVHINTNLDFPVGPHGGQSSVVITVGQSADPYDRRPETSQEIVIHGRGEMSANPIRNADAKARILKQVTTMAANWKLIPTG